MTEAALASSGARCKSVKRLDNAGLYPEVLVIVVAVVVVPVARPALARDRGAAAPLAKPLPPPSALLLPMTESLEVRPDGSVSVLL